MFILDSRVINLQGRKWLSKSGWASSNMAAMVARRRCQKVGWQLPTCPSSSYAPDPQPATYVSNLEIKFVHNPFLQLQNE